MRYSWETLKVLHCFFLSRASWIQWRSPSLGVRGREAWWDQVWVACCVFRSFARLSLLPSRLFSSLLLSFCSCIPSCPLSVFTSLLALVSITSILAYLPSSSLHPSIATPFFPLPFFRLCLNLFLCLSIPWPILPLSVLASLHYSFSTSPPPLAPPFLTNSSLTFNSLTLFRPVFLSGMIFVFLVHIQLSLLHFFFQRHDEKNGKTDEGWKRMKSCQSKWFQYDHFSPCKFHAKYQEKTKPFLKTRSPDLGIVHTTSTTVTSPWFD